MLKTSSWRRAALAALGLGLLAAGTAHAEGAAPAEPVQLRIVLLRHGVRSPTKSPADLAPWATQGWVEWPAAPGQMTDHGLAVMQGLGAWHRQELQAAGIVGAGCEALPALAIVSDSTPRNRASAAALASGLAPGCAGLGYRAQAPGQSDPLFAGVRKSGDKGGAPASFDTATVVPALAALQQALVGCTQDECLARLRTQGKETLLDRCLPATSGGSIPAPCAKALKTAGSLAENLMLEQAQGMDVAHVAWGRADAAALGRIIELHDLSFRLTQKDDRAEGRRRSANLLAHVAATLAARAGVATPVSPLAAAGVRALFLVGHDTDLASVAGLLGVSWDDARQPDDYPPGGALVFDLVGAPGHEHVRLHTAMPTLAALREAAFAPPQAMVEHALPLPDCADGCGVAAFQALVARGVDASDVAATMAPAPWVAIAPAR